jgi:hypothetical protein
MHIRSITGATEHYCQADVAEGQPAQCLRDRWFAWQVNRMAWRCDMPAPAGHDEV